MKRAYADRATYLGDPATVTAPLMRLMSKRYAAELRRTIERVAAQRRPLPPGGAVPDDYVFVEAAGEGGEVRFSQLFAPGRETLVIYSFMFPRWSGDTRPGPVEGETANGCHSPRHRAHPVPRSWTHSIALLLTLPASSTSSWLRSQTRLGSATSPTNAAGAICGCCPRAATPTTATTTRKARMASRALS